MLALRLVMLLLGLRAIVAKPPAIVATALATAMAPAAALTPPPPAATPTIDRLAAPPTAAIPNQADAGAQLYWQHCQPCHGDRAQGLTDEWRAQYPTEDQNCWNSGCHGERPYANGFKLPTQVPALVGAGSLNRFATAADLYAFMSRAMPFQAPGSLKPEEYWAITAFLLRGHGLPDTAFPISSDVLAQQIPLGAPATAVPAVPAANPFVPSVPAAATFAAVLAVLVGGGLLAGAWVLKRRRG